MAKTVNRRPMPSGLLAALYIARNAGDPDAGGVIDEYLNNVTHLMATRPDYVYGVIRKARERYARAMKEKHDYDDLMGQCQMALLLKELDVAESLCARWEEEL